MKLLKLCHATDPRYLMAPEGEIPVIITFEDLANRRYGKLLVAQVGEVVAEYVADDTANWKKL